MCEKQPIQCSGLNSAKGYNYNDRDYSLYLHLQGGI